MTYPVDPLLSNSRAQALKALLAERTAPPRRFAAVREWLAALRPVQTLRALWRPAARAGAK